MQALQPYSNHAVLLSCSSGHYEHLHGTLKPHRAPPLPQYLFTFCCGVANKLTNCNSSYYDLFQPLQSMCPLLGGVFGRTLFKSTDFELAFGILLDINI